MPATLVICISFLLLKTNFSYIHDSLFERKFKIRNDIKNDQTYIRNHKNSGKAIQMVIPGSENTPWWSDGVKFKCTECGKCCQMEGDVWITKDERRQAQKLLNLNEQEFSTLYLREEFHDWGLLKDKKQPNGHSSCIFLSEDNKCTIYEARPLQCSTYPFWPRIMKDKENWDKEAVLPEEWTSERGGCEGINLEEGIVKADEIKEKVELQAAYLRRFPVEALQLKQKKVTTMGKPYKYKEMSQTMDAQIISKTRNWVKDHVITLTLCPFAKKVYEEDSVRYSIIKNTSPNQIYNDFIDEVELLLSNPEETISTTLIILPKAFPDFKPFYAFSEFLEEQIENDDALGEQILIACFHPKHTFGELPDDDPVHFEKRSPFPTINILRAQRVDEYINLGLTEKIAQQNEETLAKQGFNKLQNYFQNL